MSTQIGIWKHEQLNYRPLQDHWTVLSLTQPWASALFIPGLKRIETRGYRVNYRGRLYIHASKGFPTGARDFAVREHLAGRIPYYWRDLPTGAIIGHVDLIDMVRTEDLLRSLRISEIEHEYGDYGPRRWGWITDSPVLLPEPIPAKGSLGLWKFRREEQRNG